MKGKWYTLAAGGSLLIFGWMNDTWYRLVLLLVAALYFYLAGMLFERYPRTPKEFTGFTTETDVPIGDLRGEPPVSLDAQDRKGTRRFELHHNDMHAMQHPIREITELLIEEGFDMSGEIVWWDDVPNNKRVFTQEA